MSIQREANMDEIPDADEVIQECLNLDRPKSFSFTPVPALGKPIR